MLDPQLKQEWLEKVKIQNKMNITDPKRSYIPFTINTSLPLASEEIQKDPDINLQAALIGEEFLWNIDKELRNNKDFILKLINNGYKREIYSYLSIELKDDAELFKLCVKRKDEFTNGISKKIIENRDLVLEGMKYHNIFPKLKGAYDLDKEIIALYLEYQPNAFQTLKKSMKNYFSSPKRKIFIISLLKKNNEASASLYPHLSTELQEDLEVIDVLLTQYQYNIKYLPKNLQEDKAFMLYAIEKYGVTGISGPLEKNKDVIKAVISKKGEYLKCFPHFQNDREMIDIAFKTYNQISLLSKELLYEKDLVLKFLQENPANAKSLLERTTTYHDDYDVMKIAVEYDASLFNYTEKLKDNRELADIVLAATGNFDLLSREHLKNKNLVLQLLDNKENCKKAKLLRSFTLLYKNDEDIVKKIVSSDPTYINAFPIFQADKNFVKFAIAKGLKEIKLVDPSLYHDKELAIKFIELNSTNYIYLPLSLKNDHEVALAAIQHGPDYMVVIQNSDLAEDLEFTLKAIDKIPTVYHHIDPIFSLQENPKIILQYISSANAVNDKIKFPETVYELYETKSPQEIKSKIMQKLLEEELPVKGEQTKKLKI